MPPAQDQIPRRIHEMVGHFHDTPLFIPMILPKLAAPVAEMFLHDQPSRDQEIPRLGQARFDRVDAHGVLDQLLETLDDTGLHLPEDVSLQPTA